MARVTGYFEREDDDVDGGNDDASMTCRNGRQEPILTAEQVIPTIVRT